MYRFFAILAFSVVLASCSFSSERPISSPEAQEGATKATSSNPSTVTPPGTPSEF